MTGILKFADTTSMARARPFSGQHPLGSASTANAVDAPAVSTMAALPVGDQATPPAKDDQPDRRPPTEALARERDELRELLAAARQESAEAEQKAFAEGKLAGESAAAERASERLEALEAALDRANRTFSEKCGEVERLALQIAEVALGRIVGTASGHRDLLEPAIRLQLERLVEENPTVLRVSPADFPDQDALDRLATGHAGLAVVADPKLREGECRLTLELGEVDLGLPGQFARLRSTFESWAEAYHLSLGSSGAASARTGEAR